MSIVFEALGCAYPSPEWQVDEAARDYREMSPGQRDDEDVLRLSAAIDIAQHTEVSPQISEQCKRELLEADRRNYQF